MTDKRGHHEWCALSNENHRGHCEAVAENVVIHREARPAPTPPDALPGHQTPGEYHDYRVACAKCGEPGFLHVSWRPEKAEEKP